MGPPRPGYWTSEPPCPCVWDGTMVTSEPGRHGDQRRHDMERPRMQPGAEGDK